MRRSSATASLASAIRRRRMVRLQGDPTCIHGSRSCSAPSARRRPRGAECGADIFGQVAAIPVEYAEHRRIRERNKLYYRFNHWPIWIFVFFIAPGPLTFDLFDRGFDTRMALWLGIVL